MALPSLLIIDDEPAVWQLFHRTFAQHDLKVLTAESAANGLRMVTERQPDVVMLDVLLPDRSGLEVFQEIQQLDPKCPVIFITAGGASGTAIEAMKRGAFDFLVKPLDLAQVRELVRRALEVRRLMSEPVQVGEVVAEAAAGDALVGRCPAMQEVYKSIGRVASKNVTVLIRGESGTGKELVARAVYQHSGRADAPFLVVNCAAIPETLLESELFGHEKGAFTGADRRRIGKFEQCTGGTLFLDEIGDMPLTLQSKVLRLLQDQRFERVGGNDTIQTNVRIIAATHRNLERMAEEGHFRSDLYYRLNVFSIELPPLRERLEDLPVLVEYFLDNANRELEQDVQTVAPAAMKLLNCYTWPGNVRELQSVLKRAVLKATGPVLLPDFLPELVKGGAALVAAPSTEAAAAAAHVLVEWDRFIDERLSDGTDSLYDDAHRLMERHVITRVLRYVGGNQVRAAKTLGITRSTLRSKIRELGIVIGRVIDTTE